MFWINDTIAFFSFLCGGYVDVAAVSILGKIGKWSGIGL